MFPTATAGNDFEIPDEAEEEIKSRNTATLLKTKQKKTSEAIDFLKGKLATNIRDDRFSQEVSERGSKVGNTDLDDISQRSNGRLAMEHMSVGVTSRTTSNANVRKTIYRYETVIRERTQFKELKFLILLILLYFLMAIITVISTNSDTHDIMKESLQASKTLRIAALRLFNLYELFRRVRCGYLVEKGFLPRNRSAAIPDYSWYCINQTVVILDDLATLNSEIVNFYHMLDESLMPGIFRKYDLDPRRSGEEPLTVTNNKAVNEFIISGLRLLSKKQPLVPLDPNDEDFTFILGNILNDPMIQGENVIGILEKHIGILTDTVYRTPIINFIIFSVCSSILIITILKVEKNGADIKRKLFFSLMRIEEKE